jgi:hypothetical protein
MRARLAVIGACASWFVVGCAGLAGLDQDFCVVDVDCPPAGGSSSGGMSGTGAFAGASALGGGTAVDPPDLPAGKLAFVRSVPASGTTSLFIATLPSGALSVELGALFGLCNPRSPAFDATGRYLAVSAAEDRNGCEITTAADSEIFILDLEQLGEPAPTALAVTANSVEDTHPSFSPAIGHPSGAYVYFAHGGRLARWRTNLVGAQPFGSCTLLPTGSHCFDAGSGLQSHPSVALTPERVCYQEGISESARIFCLPLEEPGVLTDPLADHRFPATSSESRAAFKPLFAGAYLYFEEQAEESSLRRNIARIAATELGQTPSRATFFLESSASFTDPTRLGASTLIVSRLAEASRDLFVGVFDQPGVWDLDELTDSAINSADDELEAAFFSEF